DLRRYNHGRFYRELGIVVANHHRRRRDLLHGGLRQFAFGSLQFVAISAAATAANLRLGRRQRRNVFRRRNESHGLPRFGDLLYHSSRKDRSPDNKSQQNDVHNGRSDHAIFLVIVEAPDIFYWNRLRGEHQWRLLLGKEEVVHIANQRLQQSFVESLFGQQ